MASDDAFRSRLQATIAALRYWVPSVSDVATVREDNTNEAWTLAIDPHIPGAAAFRLALRHDGNYDLTVGGQAHDGRAITSLDLFPQLVDAIAAGRVSHRHWTSAQTGTRRGTETTIVCADGEIWHASRGGTPPKLDAGADDGWIAVMESFLPYRR